MAILSVRKKAYFSSLFQGVDAVLSILDQVEQFAHDAPPVENSGSRFGNPAFKEFYDKVAEVCFACLRIPLMKTSL